MEYSKLARVYQDLESTTKSLEKTSIIAEFLKEVPEDDLPTIVLLLMGRVFPEWSQRVLGIGRQLAIRAVAGASGCSDADVVKTWKKIGDLGEAAEHLIKHKCQATLFKKRLTVKNVFETLRKIPEVTGAGSIDKRIALIKELLTSADPLSAKYITRTLLEELRVGVKAGILRDSIAKAFDVEKDAVERAYDQTSDFGEVAKFAKSGKRRLARSRLKIGQPIRVMLYKKVEDIEEGFKAVGKPSAVEFKIDGFRIEVHRKGDTIKLFTRRLEDVSPQFPDVVEVLKKNVKSKEYILDNEVIGIEPGTKRWLPFQNISERIKRKYRVAEMTKKIPVQIMPFDIMYYEGKDMISSPFKERRKVLEKIVNHVPNRLMLVPQIVTDSIKKTEKFYERSLSKGNEGIMMKNLEAQYKPGSRVGYGVKIKPIMETLDLVIVGGEWGTGKRAGWLSSFKLACRKGKEFLSIGKMGTGVKEKVDEGVSFAELTKHLKKDIIKEVDRKVVVKPKIVIEVAYEEIQKSPKYKSGYALRFPRFIRLRHDKSVSDINTLAHVEKLYESQRHRK